MTTPPGAGCSLVADVGGTNTRVALTDGLTLRPDTVRRYTNKRFDDLEMVLRQFLSDENITGCQRACIAVSGPVAGDSAELTNVGWHTTRASLMQATGAGHVAILNDLQAQGHALGFIDQVNITPVIVRPAPPPGSTMTVLGIGTGVNAATALETPNGRVVPPSEYGHCSLPVRSEAEFRFAKYIEQKLGFASIEDVLSGSGLENVYRWLSYEAGEENEKSAAEIMASLKDGTDPRSEQAVAMFVQVLGTVAGNLALIELPFGGVFLIGGVMRAMAPFLDRFGFQASFCDKGRLSDLMASFSVSVIEDDYAALTGCASHLVDLG